MCYGHIDNKKFKQMAKMMVLILEGKSGGRNTVKDAEVERTLLINKTKSLEYDIMDSDFEGMAN